MADNFENKPKRFPISLQPDLSMFEPATEEEKKQGELLRDSTSFLKDSLARLKQDKLSLICLFLVLLMTFIAFVVPLFYPYDFSTISGNVNSLSATYLGPMEYSTREKIVGSDPAVFLGWAYPCSDDSAYQGMLVIDSEEYLEAHKDLFVKDRVTMGDASVGLYAVWSVDSDGDGRADFGSEYFSGAQLGNVLMPRYRLSYDPNGAEGTVPVDTFGYVASDRIVPEDAKTLLSLEGAVFAGWSTEKLPLLTAGNYEDYENFLISKNLNISSDTVLYAVWAEDLDADGAPDGFSISYKYSNKTKAPRYRVTYNGNMSNEAAPVDELSYAAGDQIAPAKVQLTKRQEKVFPHLLGTDEIGRDYCIRVIVGTRVSLLVGIIAAVVVVIIGVLYGSVSGYFGGKVDLVMMRIVDIIYSLPDTLIIILLSVSLKDIFTSENFPFADQISKMGGVGLVSILIVFGLLYWVGMARLVRGQVLSLREQEFVLAAKAADARPWWIIRKHMLPNCISVIFISAALQIPSAIFTESFLSFLGIGVSMPMPSLGSLASEYRGQMTIAGREYLFLVPAVVIFLLVLSLNLLGQGLRDAFDPKLRVRGKH